MNLQIVPGPGFRYLCFGCHARKEFDPQSNVVARNTLWADLDGPAFKAYYCPECAFKLTEYGPGVLTPNAPKR